jgi:hypothetical protein
MQTGYEDIPYRIIYLNPEALTQFEIAAHQVHNLVTRDSTARRLEGRALSLTATFKPN